MICHFMAGQGFAKKVKMDYILYFGRKWTHEQYKEQNQYQGIDGRNTENNK